MNEVTLQTILTAIKESEERISNKIEELRVEMKEEFRITDEHLAEVTEKVTAIDSKIDEIDTERKLEIQVLNNEMLSIKANRLKRN